MPIERFDLEERQARIDKMMVEFRAARQRRLVKQGMTLWNRTEMEQGHAPPAQPPPSKLN